MLVKLLVRLLLRGKRSYVRKITLNGVPYYLTVSKYLSAEDGMTFAREILGPKLSKAVIRG